MKKPISKLKKGDIFIFNETVQMVHKKYKNDDSPLTTIEGILYHNEELSVEVLPILKGFVLFENPDSSDEDLANTVTVLLDNGNQFNFWMLGLTKTEYLRRSSIMYYQEKKVRD